MSELEERINSILGDPAQMEKITKLASRFMGGGEHEATPAESANASALPEIGGMDSETLGKLTRLLSKAGSGSDKQALLQAMSPYLSKPRREKLAKAMKLAHMAKLAGMALREYGGEDRDV
jgi:hypothetical protein